MPGEEGGVKRFPWGKVIKMFEYDFDGDTVEITKYHPWKREGCFAKEPDESKVEFHCEELRQSSTSIQGIIISWIAKKNLGLNQASLVAGACRALGVK